MSFFTKALSILFISSALFQFAYAENTLADTQSISNDESCLVFKSNFSYGANDRQTNGAVSDLQQFLKEEKYLTGNVTGFFGVNTRNAVKFFQEKMITNIQEKDIDAGLVPSLDERRILIKSGFRLSTTGVVGKYTRAKIAYMSCHDTGIASTNTDQSGNKTVTTVSSGTNTQTGACYFDEALYKNRGYKMTVTSSDSAAWISTNNMTLINGKLYLLNKPGIMWNLWDVNTNKLTSAMLSCKDGTITETGISAPKKVLTQEEVAAQNEADIKLKCNNGTYPAIYAICQPKEKRLQYLKDKFKEAAKPMSQAFVNSFGPGFENSELAFADWKYVTVGPFVVSCDELATTYNFYWLKGEGGTIGNWSKNSNRDFYDTDGKFIGSGGALISTTQYKDKITGEAMVEPNISYGAIGYCNHAGAVASTTAPTLTISRVEANKEQTLSWTSRNVTSLTYTCLDSNNKSTGEVSVPVTRAALTESWESLRKNGWDGTYYCSWKANGATTVATESFTIGK